MQPFLWNQEIIPHIQIHSTLHKKSMIPIRVLLNYSHEFKKLTDAFKFIPHHIRNESFWGEFRSPIPTNSRNSPTNLDS